MSQWTHVNASFRIDSFGRVDDDLIVDVFGKTVEYKNMYNLEYDDDFEVKNKEQYLPMGSEGSLEMTIWHNPDTSCIGSTTVSVFGDLRDFGSFDEIEKWFNKCCKYFSIRQAFCQVYIEGCGTKVFAKEFQ